ncbi:MAG: NUDIX hydrolase [Betaproteobacteria bacterium]
MSDRPRDKARNDLQPAAPQPRAPAETRDAATVVLLRDSAGGLETYLVKRSRTVDFMAGAHVFPGGRLDKADSSASACALLSADTSVLRERLGEDLPAMHAAGLYIAAIRETFEEAGLLLGSLAAGWNTDDARKAVGQGALFLTLVERLDAAALVPWVRWVTPPISPKRFDARFFLARAPAGQEPKVDGHEATEGVWITPAEALRQWAGGAIQLAPATAKSIDMLAGHGTVDAALAGAAARTPPVVEPEVWNEAGRAFISLPGDPRHALPDVLGGNIRRIQLEAGRYHAVAAS